MAKDTIYKAKDQKKGKKYLQRAEKQIANKQKLLQINEKATQGLEKQEYFCFSFFEPVFQYHNAMLLH